MALRTVSLVAQRGSITVTELAQSLGVAVSTAHRVLANCCETGYTLQPERGGPYLAGPALHELTLSITGATTLRDAADGPVQELADQTGETVNVAVLEGRKIRFVQSVPGIRPRHVGPRLGETYPAHCTAAGKAMLAYETAEEFAERYRGHKLEALTPRSITGWACLANELAEIRARGWAYSVGETDEAVSAIAAAVVLSTGRSAAAIAIAMPTSRLATRREFAEISGPLLRTTTLVQRRLRGAREGAAAARYGAPLDE